MYACVSQLRRSSRSCPNIFAEAAVVIIRERRNTDEEGKHLKEVCASTRDMKNVIACSWPVQEKAWHNVKEGFRKKQASVDSCARVCRSTAQVSLANSDDGLR